MLPVVVDEVLGDGLENKRVLEETMRDIAGQLSPSSRRIYNIAAKHFSDWLEGQGLTITTVTRSDFIEYRSHLQESYAKATANRMLITARRLLAEAVKRGAMATNPATDVRGFKADDNETPHTALSREEARRMLDVIDRETVRGKRDYALIMLLLRTGLRRSEAASLRVGDFGREQNHYTLTIRHGKGDKRRKSKIPNDVMWCIEEYLEATGRKDAPKNAPLFIQFRKGDHIQEEGISGQGIELVVKERAEDAGLKLSPHGLRASFITLALEGGAKLEQVQYAAGHSDPKTTERYQKRKFNLEDNATDYVKI